MRLDVLRDAWRRGRLSAVGWGASWAFLVALYVASWPAVRSNGERLDSLMRDLPGAMEGLFGGTGAISTAEGYLTAELLAFTGPLLVAAMGVLRGTRALAAEEEDGSLELLLAQPVGRTRVLLEKLAAAALELTLVVGLAGAALLGLSPLVDMGLAWDACLRAFLVLWLLGLEALTLGLLLGAWTGRAARSRAVAGGVLLVAFLLHAVGPSVPGMADLASWSPFSTVLDSDPFRRGLRAGAVLTLLLPSLVATCVAVLAFRRRDLRLP